MKTLYNAVMFLILAAVCVFVLVGLFGCSKHSPTAPEPQAQSEEVVHAVVEWTPPKPTAPLHHNIPATDNDGADVVWVCATQWRLYSLNGHPQWQEDHYISSTPCPDVPID